MKRGFVHYALLQSALWGGYGVVNVYASRYLLGAGLSNTQAGLAIGAATTLSLLLQPAITALVDSRKVTLRGALVSLGGVMAVCLGLAPFAAWTWLRVLVFSLANVALAVMPAFVNALGMVGSHEGLEINFGVTRGAGSLSYGIFTQIANWLITLWGDQSVPVLGLLLALGVAALSARFPAGGVPERKEKPTGMAAFFRENPRFTAFLLGSTLLMTGHSALGTSMYQVAAYKGNADAQGTALMIAAVLELPVMFLYSRMRSLRGNRVWVKLSAVFLVLRLALCLVLPGVSGIYAAQLAQMLGYALFAVSTVYYADEVVPEKDVVKAQAYLGATSTIGSLVASFGAGALMDAVGVGMMLAIFTAIAAAGALISAQAASGR